MGHRPPPPNHNGGSSHGFLETAINMMGLDTEQEVIFRESADKHNTTTQAIEKQQAKAAKEYFHTLLETNETMEDSLIHQLQQLEKDKIVTTYEHFEEVKTLLKSNQQANVPEFLDKALQMWIIDAESNRPPPKVF